VIFKDNILVINKDEELKFGPENVKYPLAQFASYVVVYDTKYIEVIKDRYGNHICDIPLSIFDKIMKFIRFDKSINSE
jgi:hypothetical protein